MPSVYNSAKRELMNVGVDWMTATTGGKRQYKLASSTAEKLIAQERDRGNEVKHATVEGYAGFQCGQIFAGALGGVMLMRLSGSLASDHWREIYDHSNNVSRLDLQATVRYSPHVPKVAERVERDVLKKLGNSKLPLDVGIVRSRRKGSTCVIGRRVSNRYLRIYNKYLESKLEEYRDCWRWEIELKRGYAMNAARQLYSASDEAATINGELLSTFKRIGASRLWATDARPLLTSGQPNRPTAARSLAWLRAGVSGRVQWLISLGLRDEVLDALGLSECMNQFGIETRKE